jgi:SAM-dependent methyltransferase
MGSNMADDIDYNAYLLKRSRLGLFYRNNVLYPSISRHLTGRTLDIGCGIGDMLRFRPGTIGVDINPNNVEHCLGQGLAAQVMLPDVLPFEAGSFDSAILDNVLEHIAEPGPLLAEIKRVMRRNGTFVVGVPGRRGYACDDDHKIFYDEAGLQARVTAAGFAVKDVVHTPLRSSWLDRNMRQYCVYGVFSVC